MYAEDPARVEEGGVHPPRGEEPDAAESFPFVPEGSTWGADATAGEADDSVDDDDEWPDDDAPARRQASPGRKRSQDEDGESPSLAEVLGDF
jgi:hypothetical protein